MRLAAKAALKYPPVVLTGIQARSVGYGIQTAIDEAEYRCYACAILPEHVHLVLGRHERTVEAMIMHLKSAVTRRLNADGLNPLQKFATAKGYVPSVWGHGGWKVFLDSVADMTRSIAYAEGNPGKEGKLRQQWPFVVSYGV